MAYTPNPEYEKWLSSHPGGSYGDFISSRQHSTGIIPAVGDAISNFATSPDAAAEAARKKALQEQAGLASSFANIGEGNYNQGTADLNAQRDYLRRIASGQDSLSRTQLQQGLQQNIAAQRSMAAGADPNSAPMMARTAAMNAARLGSGMSGQAALAGLQERRDANNALSQMMLGQRGQDVQVGLGSRQNSLGGYGAGAFGAPAQSDLEKYGNAFAGVAGLIAKSDKRAKTAIEDGDAKAKRMLKGLKAYAYKYKNESDGKGAQFGVMAQDLEKAGLGHAVIDTPSGKMVHGGKLATSNTAMLAALAKRVGELEGKK